jgi:hypothetical protein
MGRLEQKYERNASIKKWKKTNLIAGLWQITGNALK